MHLHLPGKEDLVTRRSVKHVNRYILCVDADDVKKSADDLTYYLARIESVYFIRSSKPDEMWVDYLVYVAGALVIRCDIFITLEEYADCKPAEGVATFSEKVSDLLTQQTDRYGEN